MLFLIHYDRRGGQIVAMTQFQDSDRREAEEARLHLEIALYRRGHPQDDEVVVLEAESEELIRQTHGRYFYTVEELIARSLFGKIAARQL